MSYSEQKKKGGVIMKEWYKSKRKSIEDKKHAQKIVDNQQQELEITEDVEEEKEFNSFFEEVLNKFPEKYSTIILNTYDKSKVQAEKIFADSKTQFDNIFDHFLEGADEKTKKKKSCNHSCGFTYICYYRTFTHTIFRCISISPNPINNDGPIT